MLLGAFFVVVHFFVLKFELLDEKGFLLFAFIEAFHQGINLLSHRLDDIVLDQGGCHLFVSFHDNIWGFEKN